MAFPQAVTDEVNKLNARLDQLREQYGRPVTVYLGSRHNHDEYACLYFRDEDLKLIRSVCPELTEDFPEVYERHHPVLAMLKDSHKLTAKEVRLLPGETYEITQTFDYQEVNIVRSDKSPQVYPELTADQKARISAFIREKETAERRLNALPQF
jgi:hypothetical protein